MAINKVVYMLITEDYNLAQKTKELLEASKAAWKFYTKYYSESSRDPVKTTIEESSGGA